MKKYILLFVLLFFLLLDNVFSQTVYISATGQHYHTSACKNVNKNSNHMQVSDALAHGYTPCTICHPPTGASKSVHSKKTKKSTSKTSSAKSTKSTQCTATIKSGTRCTQMTKSPNGKCVQHGGK